MKMRIWRRLLALALSAAVLLGAMPPVLAAEPGNGDFSWRQVDNSAVTARLERRIVPEEAAEEPLYTDDETVRVSIELQEIPTMARFSLEENGEYAVNSAARAYRRRLESRQEAVTNSISKQVLRGKRLDVVWNLTLAANIISANVEYGKLEDIKKVAGVKSVYVEKQYAPATVSVGGDAADTGLSVDMTGTRAGAWANGYRGQGMRVAIIDTGLDTDHQSFNAEAFEYALREDAAADGKTVEDYDLLDRAEISGVMSQLNACKSGGVTADDLYRTAKVPYGYCYVDQDLDVTHDKDSQGDHGSHVAGIAAANRYLKTGGAFASAMDMVRMTGQAPDAQLVVMKVFGNAGGAFVSDWMAAIEDAILLGCDTVNLSFGSANPGFGTEPGYPYQKIMDGLVSENTIVTVAASNSGAWSDAAVTKGELYSDDVSFSTVSSPGSYVNSLCVASVNSGETGAGSAAGGESAPLPPYAMSYFSSWGVPGDLSIKPEITAPGGNIWSVKGMGPDTDKYQLSSGTSMAAPQTAGIGALVKEFIETENYSQAGMKDRALAQSLMMSTATPLKDENGQYYPVLQQGAGLVNAAAATSADSYITVDGQTDGKVKFELGDDPDKTGKYQVKFDIHNLDGETREYELSGELFTQAVRKDGEKDLTYLTKSTVPLDGAIRWTLEGGVAVPEKSVRGCDFNGDGTVDRADAQLLLDHVVKGEELVKNRDKADIDGDGNEDTHDVHEFLKKLDAPTVAVPGKGSITVTADIEVDADAAAAQMADCPNGFYVEGYLKAAGKAVDDGEAGTAHSIPLLGYYGNWSDPSMFEKGSTLEYVSDGGSALPDPYMKEKKWLNWLRVEYADGSSGMLGANPYDVDAGFCDLDGSFCPPDCATLSSENGDMVVEWFFSPIRNAAASRVTVKSAADPELIYQQTGNQGPVESAYYDHPYWHNSVDTMLLSWKGTDAAGAPLPEDTAAEITVTLAPEYYVNGRNVAWEDLGRGASFTQRVTIDNTAPEITAVRSPAENDRTVEITAVDNHYVAAIALVDPTGRRILSYQCPDQVEKGGAATVTLDLSQVVGKKFLLQAMDYACNTYTCEVEFEGLTSEITDPDYVFFNQESFNWYGLQNGPPQKLGVLGGSPAPIYAAELVNGCLFALDGPEAGDTAFSSVLYAMPVGDAANSRKICTLEYKGFDGEKRKGCPLDMAYSKTDHKLYILIRVEEGSFSYSYLYSVDPMTGAVEFKGFPLKQDKKPLWLATLAIDDSNRFYGLTDSAESAVGTSLFQFGLSDLSTAENKEQTMPAGVRLDKSLSCLWGYASTDWDSRTGKLIYALTPASYSGQPKGPTVLYELDPGNPVTPSGTVYTDGKMYCAEGLALKDTDDVLDFAPTNQATEVILSETERGMAKGGSFQLEALVAPWTLENREVLWSSDNPEVASVTDDGTVTAVSPGTATITAASAATPTVKATCTVTVAAIEADLRALLWDSDMAIWWAGINTARLPSYERIQEADIGYDAVAVTEGGRIYGASGGPNRVSGLYSVDPDTLEGTRIGTIKAGEDIVYADDLAPIPLLSEITGTDYLLGIYAGAFGLIINAETAEVENYFELNNGAIVSPVGLAFVETCALPVTGGELLFDLYAYVGADGGVHEGYVMPYGESAQEILAVVQQDANFETGVSTNGCIEHNSLVFADAEDGNSYLFWSVYDGDESLTASADLYAIDPKAQETYLLGSFPGGTWPVTSLVAEKDLPSGGGASGQMKAGSHGFRTPESMAELGPELLEKIKEAQETQMEKRRYDGGLCSIEVKDDEGHPSAQAVTVDETAKTVTVPITVAQSTNGRFVLSYDESVLALRSVSHNDSVLYSEAAGTSGEIVIGYADSDEVNGKLAEAVFTYEPAEEEQTAVVSLKIAEDGETYNATPADGGSVEIILPAKPAEPVPSPITPATPVSPGPDEQPKPDTPKFLDVPESAWYHDDVYRAAEMGLMSGTGAALFSPGARLTRGMLAAILYRLEGEPETAAEEEFADVPSGKWFSAGVNWAASEGIVAGYGNGRYGPDDLITREQFAAILARYAKLKAYDTEADDGALEGYRDKNRVSGWAVDGIAWACEAELIYGKGGGLLDPQGKAARSEAAAILIRFIDKMNQTV